MRRLALIKTAAIAMGLTLPVTAHAATYSFNSDAAFTSSPLSGAFTESGAGEVRWGNGSGTGGDWEYAVTKNQSPIGNGKQNRDWNSNGSANVHDLTFSYNSSGQASLGVGVSPNASGNVGGGANTVLIRTKAGSDQTSMVRGISITAGSTAFTLSSLIGDSDAEYIGLVDGALSGGFTLSATGNLAEDTSGNGSGSLPAYQIKVGTTSTPVTSVPVPATLGLFGIGLLAMGMFARRKAA